MKRKTDTKNAKVTPPSTNPKTNTNVQNSLDKKDFRNFDKLYKKKLCFDKNKLFRLMAK